MNLRFPAFIGGFDADAASFFTRAGIIDGTQKQAVNTMVVSLKAASLWSKMTVLYPFVGGTATAHAQNLKANQYNITWVGGAGVTHNANGVQGNGTTGYGNTNMLRNALGLTSVHLSAYARSFTAAFSGAIGIDDGGTGHFTDLYHTPASTYEFGNNTASTTAATGNMVGHTIGSRSATQDQIIRPGLSAFVTNTSAALADHLAGNFFVLAINRNGSAGLLNADPISLISAGSELTLAECLTFREIVNTYQADIGRAV